MKKMNISKRIKKAMVTMAITAMAAMTVPTITFAAETDGSKSGRLPAGQEEPAHYHQPGWIAKEPTCTEPGLMQDICPYHPDYVWSEEEIPALGHDMGEWVVIKEATYEEEGLKVRDCSRGDLHEEEAIPKLEKEAEEEPVHEHSYGEWVVTKEATCNADGEAERTCECGDKEIKSISAHGHDYEVTKNEAPTCTKDGVKVETCKHCGDEIVTVVPALGHDYNEWYVVKAPEVGVEGIEEHVCSRCGHKEQRTIPALTDDNTPEDDIVPEDDDEVTPDDDDNTPDVLSEYIPEDDDTDDAVNNEPDVLSEYIPQTGDTNNVIIYIVMMLGALLVLVAATRKEEQ